MTPRTWIWVTLTLVVIATGLHLAGLFSPCWIYFKTSDYKVGVGLYFRVGCGSTDGGNCTDPAFPTDLPFQYDNDHTYDQPEWEAVVWLQTIAGVTSLILCMMTIVYLVGFGAWSRMGALNMFMTLTAVVSWVFILAGLIVYMIFYGEVITRSPDVSSRSFPWSALMVLIAAILFIIISVLVRTRCRNRNYLRHSIPTSADSKMALNPSTKSQVMKRYFTPSPYREARRDGVLIAPATTSDGTQGTATMAATHINNLDVDNYFHQHYTTAAPARAPSPQPPANGIAAAGAGGVGGVYHAVLEQTTWPEENVVRAGPSFVSTSRVRTDNMISNSRPGIGTSPPSSPQAFGRRVVTAGVEPRGFDYSYSLNPEPNNKIRTTQTTLARRSYYTAEALKDTHIPSQDPRHSSSETIFYTGESSPYQRFSFVPGVTTIRDEGHGLVNRGFVHENVEYRVPAIIAPPQVAPQPQLLSLPEPSPEIARRPSTPNFRLSADHFMGEPFKGQHITTHLRTRPPHGAGRVLNGVPVGNGDGFVYNGTYIYRPYSEQTY